MIFAAGHHLRLQLAVNSVVRCRYRCLSGERVLSTALRPANTCTPSQRQLSSATSSLLTTLYMMKEDAEAAVETVCCDLTTLARGRLFLSTPTSKTD